MNAARQVHVVGQRPAITNCLKNTCQALIATSNTDGNCGGCSPLTLVSETEATLILASSQTETRSRDTHACVLTLTRRNIAPPVIDVSAVDQKKCNYYCTPSCTFTRSFTFTSKTNFHGDDIPGCFLRRSRAIMAVCQDQAFAAKQDQWLALASDNANLQDNHLGSNACRDDAYAKCNAAEQPAACLNRLITTESEEFTRAKTEWLVRSRTPGDEKEAEKKAAAMIGCYEQHFTNGDVSGKRDSAVDTLEIKPEERGAIQFKMFTNFYNGHMCEVGGTAAYRATGVFVFESKERDESCLLEISAGRDAVEFRTPVGGCRAYCGACGSLGGTKFLYSERIPSRAH